MDDAFDLLTCASSLRFEFFVSALSDASAACTINGESQSGMQSANAYGTCGGLTASAQVAASDRDSDGWKFSSVTLDFSRGWITRIDRCSCCDRRE